MDDQRRDPADSDPAPDGVRGDLGTLMNGALLAELDLLLLELERRLYRYARSGSELVHIADEGLLLAVRSRARLTQALASAQHTERHLQVVGIGQWQPTGTGQAWNADARVVEDDEPGRG
jgi:hypothetical protein